MTSSYYLNRATVRRLIRERGMNQIGVARLTKTNESTCKAYLRGARSVTLEWVESLANVLNVADPYELLGPNNPRKAVLDMASAMGIDGDELDAHIDAVA